jgi:hypothetical protein
MLDAFPQRYKGIFESIVGLIFIDSNGNLPLTLRTVELTLRDFDSNLLNDINKEVVQSFNG